MMRTLTNAGAVIALAVVFAAGACKKDDDEKKTTDEPSQPEAEAEAEGEAEGESEGETEGETERGAHGEEVTYTAGDTTLKGYLAWDPAIEGQRPGVLVVHEWWGHNEYARERARMLAEMGYTALAVDMYGEGKQAAHPEDAQKFMAEVMENMDAAVARFEAAKTLLEQHETTDPEKIAAIGYCFGGGVVLHMARTGMDLDGVASFHGVLEPKTKAQKGEVEAKILVLHGAADPFVPAEQVEAIEKEMKQAGADLTIHQYEGAKHAFTNPKATEMGEKFGMPLAYDAEADAKSWAELETFLAELWADE